MDNLTHALAGAALARTRLGSMSRLAPLVLVLGANLPDVDVVWSMVGGKENYLVHHRGFTHSLLGVVVGAVVLAAICRFVERRFFAATAPAGFRAWLVPALVSGMTHPALDLLNTYGVRPWLPFSTTRYHGDLVYIVDPWLWLAFGGIAAVGGRTTRVGNWTWIVIAAGTSFFLFTEDRTPAFLKLWWPLGLGSVVLLRAIGAGTRWPPLVLRTGAIVVALYLGGLELAARIAWRNVDEVDDVDRYGRVAMRAPSAANPGRWRFYFESEEWVEVFEADVTGGARHVRRIGPRRLSDPLVLAAADSRAGAAWRYFARLPWAVVEEELVQNGQGGQGGRVRLVLADARYQFTREPSWSSVEVELSAEEAAGTRAAR